MQLFYQPDIQTLKFLNEEESRHCTQVLRKQSGDLLMITDGKGGLYECVISNSSKKKVEFRIIKETSPPKSNYILEIAIAPTKSMDRMEWFVEKCVELGVDRIVFIKCKHSERKQINLGRLKKKAIAAMKQSVKVRLPELTPLQSFNEAITRAIDQKYIAFIDHDNPNLLINTAEADSDTCVFIGPEGDFNKDEVEIAVQHGYQKISLGKSRLRTETAGIAACHIIHLINEMN